MTIATATAPAPTKRRGIKLKDRDTVTEFPAPVEPPFQSVRLPVELINADPRLQFRVDGLDQDYVSELVSVYIAALDPGVPSPPPLVVFEQYQDPPLYWLADGFHRHAAAVAADLRDIRVHVYKGDRKAAMRYALQANGKHGRRRTLEDAVHAYRCAIAESLVEPGDAPAVAALLGISDRWAREITKEARERVTAERDATIRRLAEEGQTQRQIAEQVGMTQQGVGKLLNNKRKSSESSQDKSRANVPMDPDPSVFTMSPSAPDPQQPAPAEDHPLRAAKAAYLRLSALDRSEFREWLYGESHG